MKPQPDRHAVLPETGPGHHSPVDTTWDTQDLSLGIELGSTRIKACLIDMRTAGVLATGSHEWASTVHDGYWTYDLDDVRDGLQAAYRDLMEDCARRHGSHPTSFGAMGISAMMHGYLAFDKHDHLLVPFRTWRNTTTAEAARALSAELGVNIPQRWSIAHLYQAVLAGESHVPEIARITTLGGYVHQQLTGMNVLGVGDASGMFPIGDGGRHYDPTRLAKATTLLAAHGFQQDLRALLPDILVAGQPAGTLTAHGAQYLDPTGQLEPGVPLCPPEGDAGTGMVATGAVAPRTGNVSAGTSMFAMVVLEAELATARPEIDVVATPSGDPVAMVHCNNGANEIAAWVGLFRQWADASGFPVEADAAFAALLDSAAHARPDAAGMLLYNFTAGEPVVDIAEGRPLFARQPDTVLTLPDFARAQVYGTFAALSVGMQMLSADGVRWEHMFAHGGMFRTPGVAQRLLAAALNVPVTVGDSASEGGAWGMAVLAAYGASGSERTLETYLSDTVFAGAEMVTVAPDPVDVAGYGVYLARYRAGLELPRMASNLI